MRALLLLLFVPALAFAQAGGPPFIPVNMMKVAATPVSNTVNAVGALIAEDSVVLRPEIDGRIIKLLFQEGQPVKKGAVLVMLDSSEPRARLAAAQADLRLAQSRYRRSEELVAQNFISKQALDEARANLDILRARLQQEQVALDKTVIRAPFAALAGLRQVSPGAYVNKGDDIVRLDALGNLKLEVPVPETYLPLVRIGLPINLTVDALPGQSFSGKVHAIDPVVDPVSRNVRVRARIANPAGSLKPGMFARATANLGGKTSAILLPCCPSRSSCRVRTALTFFWRSTARPNCARSRWASANRAGSKSSPAWPRATPSSSTARSSCAPACRWSRSSRRRR